MGPFEGREALQRQLDGFVHYYNDIRPHRHYRAARRYRPTAPA
jgi:hypothetical protein